MINKWLIQNKLFHNLLHVGLGRTLVFLIPFLILPFLYNNYEIEKIREFSLTLASYLIFNTIIDFGTTLYGSYLTSTNFRIFFAKKILFIRIILFIALGTFGLFFIKDKEIAIAIILSGTNLFNFNFYFQGKLKNNIILYQDLIGRGLFLSLFFLIVSFTSNVLVGLSIGMTISNTVKIYFNRKLFKHLIFHYGPINSVQIRDFGLKALSYGLSRYFIVATTEANQIYIKNLGSSTIANYSIVEVFYKITKNLGSLLSQVLMPYFLEKKNKTISIQTLTYSVLGVVLAFYVLYVVLPHVIIGLYGAELFKQVSYSFNLFFVASIFTFINAVIGYPLHSLFGIVNLTNYSTIIASIIYMLIIYYNRNQLSVNIIALATVISEGSNTIIRALTLLLFKKQAE